MAPTIDDSADGPPRSLLIAAAAVAVSAVIAVLVIAAVRQLPEQLQPVPIVSVPAPRADSPECRALMDALPERLGDYRRAEAADPAPAGAAAWQNRPDADVGAPIQVVEPVQWFEMTDAGRSTWFAVDRPVYIALTLPSTSGPTPIQEISEAISQTMPARPIDPAPAR